LVYLLGSSLSILVLALIILGLLSTCLGSSRRLLDIIPVECSDIRDLLLTVLSGRSSALQRISSSSFWSSLAWSLKLYREKIRVIEVVEHDVAEMGLCRVE
jgi:hypothetical protein